ncbi:Lactose permease [Salix suchowensis]|nr:Lactose permease [Salix suchowensis]
MGVISARKDHLDIQLEWYLGSIVSAWSCFASYDQAREYVVMACTDPYSGCRPTAPGHSHLVGSVIAPIRVVTKEYHRLLPESPRFLVSKGLVTLQEGQAARTLAKYHANGGDERDPLVVFEIARYDTPYGWRKKSTRALVGIVWFHSRKSKALRIIVAIALFSQWRWALFRLHWRIVARSYHALAVMAWCRTTSTWSLKVSAFPVHAPKRQSTEACKTYTEETAALFDGDQQQQDLVLMGGEAATMTMGQRDSFNNTQNMKRLKGSNMNSDHEVPRHIQAWLLLYDSTFY